MRQQFDRSRQSRALTPGDGLTEFHRVPVGEDSRQQVEAGHAVMLSFTCPVAQFALTKAQVRLAQAAMSNRDTSVAELCRELRIKPVTLYRYVGPDGELRKHGKQVLSA